MGEETFQKVLISTNLFLFTLKKATNFLLSRWSFAQTPDIPCSRSHIQQQTVWNHSTAPPKGLLLFQE